MVKSEVKISIAGSGYVGMSLAALLIKNYNVTVYDIDVEKINLINNGLSSIKDPFIDNYIQKYKTNLSATSSSNIAFKDSDIVIIATPTNYDDNLKAFNTSSVDQVLKKINLINPSALVVLKSTVPVGYTSNRSNIYTNMEIIFSPEFLREGTSLQDNLNPDRIIIGGTSKRSKLFGSILDEEGGKKGNVLFMSSTEAESVKLFSNTYLAMRVAFFNELDTFAIANDLNAESIINGTSSDNRIGHMYNNPSFGYGGYCLPKDTKQLLSSFNDIPQTLIGATVKSNSLRKKFIADHIYQLEKNSIGIYNLTMKKNSNNFRSSAVIDVLKILSKKGINIQIFEPSIADKKTFLGFPINNNLKSFKSNNNLIICNRVYDDLLDVKGKLFSRDIFGSD